MSIILKTGFVSITHNIKFQPQTLCKGKLLVSAGHVRDAEELRTKQGQSSIFQARIIRQTSVTLTPYKMLLEIISSHPTDNISRLTHILDGREVECCPCPPRSAPPRSADCPCAADSDGAASMLLPRVLQPLRSATTAEPNEETKPLLHPEVDLASSMLETLREVTEEEYQDAVARDAARSAAKNSNPDATNLRDSSDTNLVTILINPESNEDVASEASEVKESRCSLGNERNSVIQPKNIFKKKLFDMDNAASVVQEKVAGINKGLEGLKLRNSKLLFPNINQPKKVDKKPGFLSLSRSKGADERRTENVLDLLKVPNFRLNHPLKKIHEQVRPTNLGRLGAKKNEISNVWSNEDETLELDNGISPSNQQEQFAMTSLKKHKHLLGIPSLIDRDRSLIKKPFTLNTLWKLKDVELIPPKPIQTKINLPSLDLPPPVPKFSLGKTDPKSKDIDHDTKLRDDKPKSFIQVIPRDKTKILDAVPSSSDNHISIVENVNVETTTIAFEEVDVDPTATNSSESQLSLESDEVVAENAHQLQFSSTTEKPVDSKTPQGAFDYDETVGSEDSDIVIDGADYADIPQEDINISNQGELISDFNLNPESFDTINSQDQGLLPSIGDEAEIIIVSDDPQIPEEVPVSIEFNPFEDSDTGANNDFAQITGEIGDIEVLNIQVGPNFRSAESVEPKVEKHFLNERPKHITQLKRSEDTILEPSEIIQDKNDDSADMILDRESSVEDEMKAKEDNDQINMKKLQKISDFLLEANAAKTIKGDSVSDNNQCLINEKSSVNLKNTDLGKNENDDSEASEISDIDTAATNQEEASLKITTSELFAKEDPSDTASEGIGKPCQSDDSVGKNDQEAKNVIEKPNQMETGASEQVSNTSPLTRASLLPNVVQPTFFGGNNLFGGDNFPLIPINRNLLNIPGLESLNPRLSDILGLESKSADLSDEFEDAIDCADAAGKSSDASTGAQTLIPSFRPLEDIDFDIFRINPFNQNNALSAKMPTLNLNTFKSRLALPDSLDLRPVRLQSSIGNNKDGLLGATLTFGPNKLGSSNKGKSSSHSKSAFSSSFGNPTDILRASLPTLPSLEELRDKMRSNAENLLNSPLTSTLRSSPIGSLSDNLRTHTENTMRNIQNSFTSKLNEVTKNPKYAQPESLLERFSSAREDFGDKLQAIHMDLTDRLTSAHDRIFDKTRLSSIPLPLSKSNINSKSKKTLQSPEPNGKFKIHKHPKSKSSSSSNNAQTQIKPFKMSKAASSLSPKTVQVPKLTSVSTEPPFARSLRNELNAIKEIRAKSQSGSQQQGASNMQTANKLKNTSQKSPNRFNSNWPSPSGHNLRLNSDARGYASELQPTVVTSKILTKKPSSTHLQFRKVTPISKPLTTNDKQKTIPPEERSNQRLLTKSSASNQVAKTSIAKPKPITAPKSAIPKTIPSLKKTLPQSNVSEKPRTTILPSSENPLLTKIREALRARFPNLNPKLTPTKATFDPKPKSDDMLRAASENSHVKIADGTPLKENVSYRCKMVCVKEPIEKR